MFIRCELNLFSTGLEREGQIQNTKKQKWRTWRAIHSLLNYFADLAGAVCRGRSRRFMKTFSSFLSPCTETKSWGAARSNITWSNSRREVKALAVLPEYQGQGLGKRLLQTTIDEGRRRLGCRFCFSLLTIREALLKNLVSNGAKKSALPHKVWTEMRAAALIFRMPVSKPRS